jgi:hypothetical protein
VARDVRPMTAASSLVSLPSPSDSPSTIAWSMSSSFGRLICVVKMVARNLVAISSSRGSGSPGSRSRGGRGFGSCRVHRNARPESTHRESGAPGIARTAGPHQPSEGLGSSSEVEGFRVEVDHRLLVIRLPARGAAELLQHLGVSSTVGGADTHIGARLRARALEIVRAGGTRMYLNGENLRAPPRQDPRETAWASTRRWHACRARKLHV